jgi:hypothetical protein
MMLKDEQLSVLDPRSYALLSDARFWLEHQTVTLAPTAERCKDMVYIAGELATALLALKEAKRVIGMVEWIGGGPYFPRVCPWCDATVAMGHEDYCDRQKILES